MIHKPLPKRFTPYNQRMPMQKCEIGIKNIQPKAIKLPFSIHQSGKQIYQPLPNYFTMDHQKMPMQKYEINQLNANSKSLKIPFASICLPDIELNSKTETFKQKQTNKLKFKTQNTLDCFQRCKRGELLNRLQDKQSNSTIVTLIQQNKSYKYELKHLPLKQSLINKRIKTQGNIDGESVCQQSMNIRKNKLAKQKYQFPLLSLNKIKQRIKRKIYDWKKQYSLEQALVKQQNIMKCYNAKIGSKESCRDSRKSLLSTNRKGEVRTKKQIQNQFLLQKILTIKPSHELSRQKLTSSYSKHQQYKKLKQSRVSRESSLRMSRSRTLSIKNQRFGKTNSRYESHDRY